MSTKGFTLIEVLVGIVLIALIITLQLNFLLKTSQQLTTINHNLIANNLARLKLEASLQQNYSDLTTTSMQSFSAKAYKSYKYQIISTQLNRDLKQVIVKVKDQNQVRAKLITYKAKEN